MPKPGASEGRRRPLMGWAAPGTDTASARSVSGPEAPKYSPHGMPGRAVVMRLDVADVRPAGDTFRSFG